MPVDHGNIVYVDLRVCGPLTLELLSMHGIFAVNYSSVKALHTVMLYAATSVIPSRFFCLSNSQILLAWSRSTRLLYIVPR